MVDEDVGEAESGRRQDNYRLPFKKNVSIFPSKTERKNESTLFRMASKIEVYLKSPPPFKNS
jgi:hypothetical protein